jgi:hypothetical protein
MMALRSHVQCWLGQNWPGHLFGNGLELKAATGQRDGVCTAVACFCSRVCSCQVNPYDVELPSEFANNKRMQVGQMDTCVVAGSLPSYPPRATANIPDNTDGVVSDWPLSSTECPNSGVGVGVGVGCDGGGRGGGAAACC